MKPLNLLDDKEKRFEHWWPVSLQQFWVAGDGTIGKEPPAQVARKKPVNRAFGGARLAHFVELNGSWTHSYEKIFQSVDNDAPAVVGEILPRVEAIKYRFFPILRSVLASKNHPDALAHRFSSVELQNAIRCDLLRTALSVVVRSPGYRYRASFGRKEFGTEFSPELGKARIYFDWRTLCDVLAVGISDMTVLFLRAPPSKEFIFGDSFIENCIPDLKSRIDGRTSTLGNRQTLLVFPLSADIAVMFVFGCERPFTAIADVIHHEVDEINDTVQRLAIKEIFYRTLKPLPPIPPSWAEKREVMILSTSFVARMVASVVSASAVRRSGAKFR